MSARKPVATGTARSGARQRGVTLIEVLVGLMIFMIGALGMIGFVGKSMSDSAESRARADAAFAAQEFFARIDAAMTNDGRGANLVNYGAALNAVVPSLFDAWNTQYITSTAPVLPNASASWRVVGGDQTAQIELTINWRIRSDTSAQGLEAAPLRRFVTSRPVI